MVIANKCVYSGKNIQSLKSFGSYLNIAMPLNFNNKVNTKICFERIERS